MTDLNLVEQYEDEFVQREKDNFGEGRLNMALTNIKVVQEITGQFFLSWSENDIAIYLSLFEASSPRGLFRYVSVLTKFSQFIAAKIGQTPPKYKIPNMLDESIIDYDRLAQQTLTYEQYIHIKNQLTMFIDGEEVNFRDKVIFELAWAGLTNEEIKLLKEEDIVFTTTELGLEVAILEMENRVQRIEDLELIEDLKKCMKEQHYYVETKNGVIKKMSYRDSPYLIKPVKVGFPSNYSHINNPSVALRKTLRGQEIKCEGIDVDYLSVEDIRRSKLIYLLAPQNEKYFDVNTVKGIYNLKTDASITWLKEVAAKKYSEAIG